MDRNTRQARNKTPAELERNRLISRAHHRQETEERKDWWGRKTNNLQPLLCGTWERRA